VLTFKLEGFKELDRALGELPKATARNVLKRTLKKAADPVAQAAQANAPHETGTLEHSVIVGTNLTRSQSRGVRREGKSFAEIYIGTSLGRGMFTEFGTFKDHPQLWFTRAWESTQAEAMAIISTTLGTEIEKAAARLARKRLNAS
jgi:HK97 gp10 family phage protein